MNVSLISFTPEARELLLFTKQTRLSMDAGLMSEIRAWPEDRKREELNYMLGTIHSSWEFCDYVFSIDGVSRAFTHQLVRSRSGHYAQQSQRTVDMTDFDYVTPFAFSRENEDSETEQTAVYEGAMRDINDAYNHLIEVTKANPQDARGILPTNICTNIIAKFNLRNLSDMAKVRLCTRTQGEYQNVFREMRKRVLEVHPWADPFIRVACAADGVCCFPNYAECPIKPGVYNPDTGRRWDGKQYDVAIDDQHEFPEMIDARPMTKAEIQVLWKGTRFEAVPKEVRK